MTAREQLRYAAEMYRTADWHVYSHSYARIGSDYRLICYQRWIAAVIRFRREG